MVYCARCKRVKLVVIWDVILLVVFVMLMTYIALLAPSPSALRMMLSICEEFALTHG